MQEDGWVICRVFKKKNLFKVGNEGGSSSMNSSDRQQLNNTSSTNQARSFMHTHRDNEYLLRQQHSQAFELNNPSLHYAHLQPPPQYSLFQPQALIPTHKPIAGYDYTQLPSDDSPGHGMVKQLMTNPRDCESGSESLRYQGCEPGLEVGTCGPNQAPMVAGGGGRDHHDQGGMNEWAMLDRLVTSHLGNEQDSSSKGARYDQDANAAASSVTQINNHLSLRGEMDFWGYGK